MLLLRQGKALRGLEMGVFILRIVKVATTVWIRAASKTHLDLDVTEHEYRD